MGKAKRTGKNLSNQLDSTYISANGSPMDQSVTTAIAEFDSEIQEVYAIFTDSRDAYPAAARIDVALQEAFNAASQANQAATQADLAGVKSHLRQAITNLELSDVLITYGDIANPIDFASYMVRQQYVDFLNREPDEPGFAAWVSILNNCAAGDTSCDRVHVSEDFFKSPEFQQRGYFAYRFYPVAFGRKPDYLEFMPDIQRLSGFLDSTQLEAGKVALIADFMARPAFVAIYNPLNNTQYVDTLLTTAAVTLPAATRQALIDGLNAATLTRAQVLRQIVESDEVSTKYFNQAFVVMEYFGYLRRDPDILYLQWIQFLDSGASSRTMVSGFVNSLEYRQRFGTP